MAIPKFSELSTSIQILLILVLGAIIWGVSEYLFLKPIADTNDQNKKKVAQLDKDLEPLRPYEKNLKTLVAGNQQLQNQLATLKQIVPDEKEVDNFIRMVEGTSQAAGVNVRRFTAKPAIPQDYYVEVPFEMEMDGPYFQVLDFYDRLSKMARIINVSDLKMGSIEANKSVGNKQYAYTPTESAVAVCTITTFFSREEEAPKPGQPGKPPLKK